MTATEDPRRQATEWVELVEPGWSRVITLVGSNTKNIRVYPDGTWRFWHLCKVVDGTGIICAPALRLDGGHRVVTEDPLTIDPSILCPDCGAHGFVRDGRWVPA